MRDRAVAASVIVCTRNRADLLRGCIESILADGSSVSRELIIVDNGSTDATHDVICSFQEGGDRLPVYELFEERPGHSRARNAGIATARGRVLLFTDDDVLVKDGWADALVNRFSSDSVGAVGGRILPRWPYPPPDWMKGPHSVVVTLRDFGTEPKMLAPPDVPVGANMAIRASALRQFQPPFSTELGHRHGIHGGSEESLLLEKIADEYELAYEPSAVVIHRIQPERVDWDWMRRAFFQIGLTLAKKEALQGTPSVSLARRIVRSYRTYRGAQKVRRSNLRIDNPKSADAAQEFGEYLWAGKHLGAVLISAPGALDWAATHLNTQKMNSPEPKHLSRHAKERAATDLCAQYVLVSTFPPLRDGIARYAEQLAENLRRAGHSVVRISPPGGTADSSFRIDGGLRPLRLLRATNREDEVVVMWHPLFFVTGGAVSRAWAYASLGFFTRKRRSTIIVHEPDARPLANRIGLRRVADALEERARRWSWNSPATLSFHSERERDDFLNAHPGLRDGGRLTISEHGEFFRPYASATPDEARRRLGLDDGLLFLCIGFIGRHKGFDRAVRAFAELPSGMAKLQIVGSLLYETNEARAYADELSDLVEQVDGACMEERFLDDAELDLWIQAADAVLAPYRSAASSSVVARARLLETRVVATAVGGLPEQLGSGDILVTNDDELTKALSDLARASSAAVSA
jgi:glucosyl-dolichyl phosphate glucuronosyltransferase